MIDNYPEEKELNLAPNLVNHIDYLIDGSTVNKWRTTDTTSIFWEDTEILNELEVKIEEYKREKLL